MVLPGETGHIGHTCPDCKMLLKAQVLHSNAGYYIGTACNCGPYSRETEYMTKEEATLVLKNEQMFNIYRR